MCGYAVQVVFCFPKLRVALGVSVCGDQSPCLLSLPSHRERVTCENNLIGPPLFPFPFSAPHSSLLDSIYLSSPPIGQDVCLMSTLLRQSVTGLGSVQRTEPQTQVRTEEEVTVETSLSVVNELTVSGVSVVAYLRGFFPEDNFVDKRIFPVARLTNSASQPSQSQSQSQPGLTSLKVKTLNKGASKEGDEFIRFLVS